MSLGKFVINGGFHLPNLYEALQKNGLLAKVSFKITAVFTHAIAERDEIYANEQTKTDF